MNTRWLAAAAWTICSAGCGQVVYLQDILPADGGPMPMVDRDGGPDAGRDAGLLDSGENDLSGHYQMVYQRDPARVICTGELVDEVETFEDHNAVAAGLEGGVTSAVGDTDTLVFSGMTIERDHGVQQIVLTRDVHRPFIFSGALRISRSGPNGTTADLVTIQVERQDPDSGILRGNVQQRYAVNPARGLCNVDYQLTLYACGIGC